MASHMGHYHENITKNHAEMTKYYQMAIDLGSASAMGELGNYHANVENYEKMTKYYLMAIDLGSVDAMVNLGIYYEYVSKFNEAKKYYELAVDSGDKNAMFCLGMFYLKAHEDSKMEKYFLLGLNTEVEDEDFAEDYEIELGTIFCHLGSYYHTTKQYEKMEEYWLKAIEQYKK